MPFSSGTFSRVHDWTSDRDAGIKISASRTDAEFDGIATGLTTCILKDGTQTLTAMIPFTLGLSVPTDKKIQIRDSAIFINSSTDGQLDIDSDTKMVLTSPIVDIDASTAVEISNDLKLNSDGAILGFGADNEVTLTHVHDTGLTLNTALTATSITTSSTVDINGGELILDADADTSITADTDDRIDFKTAGSDRMKINSNGSVGIASDVTTSDLNIGAGVGSYATIQMTPGGATTGNIIYFGDSTDADYSSITSFGSSAGENGRIRFIAGTKESLNILNDGTVTVTDGDLKIGTSGHGIDFSATSTSGQGSMTSELLDVYEEGTFSPSAGDYSGTMTFTTAYYTKIGRIVNFAFKMTGDGTSDSSQINITGFPYAVLQEHAVSLSFNTGATVGELPNAMVNTAEICYFYVPSGSGFTYTMLGSGYVRVAGTYKTTN